LVRKGSIVQYLALLALAAIVPFSGLIAYDIYTRVQQDSADARATVLRLAQSAAFDVEGLLRRAEVLVTNMAQRPLVQALDGQNCDPILAEYGWVFQQATNLLTVDADGIVVCAALKPAFEEKQTVDPKLYLDEVKRTGALVTGRPNLGFITGKWVVSLAHPIVDADKQVRGAAVLPIDLIKLSQSRNYRGLPPRAVAGIIDSSGMFIARSQDPEKWIGRRAEPLLALDRSLKGENRVGQTQGVDGVERIFAFQDIAGTRWTAIVGIPVADLYATTKQNAAIGIVVSLLTVLFSAVLCFGLARRIVQPVQAIAEGARQAAAGNTDVHVDPAGPAEIAAVATEFNHMLAQRALAESRLRDLNRTLTVLISCNQTLVHAASEQQLLDEMCRVLVEEGGYALAWIGFAQHDDAKKVKVVASRGATGYLEKLETSWADNELGNGPTGIAIRSGQPVAVGNMQADDRYQPWRANAEHFNFRSSVAIPLGNDQPALGALCIYSTVPDHFIDQELLLLIELAHDIAYGIQSLRAEQKRHESERALRESEERFRQLAENIDEVFWITDASMDNILYVSPAYERIWQHSVDDLYRNPHQWATFLHPDDRERVFMAMREMQTTGEYEVEFRIQRPDGRERWIRGRGFPIRDAQGKIYRVAGTSEDFTDRKQVQDDARRLADQLAATMENISDAFIMLDREAERQLQRTREDLLGQVMWDEFREAVNTAADVEYRQAMRTQRTTQFEQYYPPLGKWFAVRAYPSPEALAVYFRDISELKHAEETLKKERALLRAVVDAIPERIYVKDREGRFLLQNATNLKVRGITNHDEIVNKTVFDIFPRALAERLHAEDQAVMESGTPVLDREGQTVFGTPTATSQPTHWHLTSKIPLKDEAGKVYGLVGVNRDITDRKRAEAALRQLNEELEDKVAARTADLERARREAEEANSAKSMFLATMSHEIRTPMNGVIGMIDVLHQTSLKGDQVEMVELIRESAFSLLGIINDILDFSRIEAGRLEIEREAVTLENAVESVCSLLNNMAEKRNVTLTLFTDPAMPAQVMGDALRLRQVLTNLVNNAIKFSSGQLRAGRVSVRARLVEQSEERVIAEFQVKDNGVGMDEETQARLFTAFTQADASTTRRFGGTGLGLAIAHQLVKLMGGDIKVRSALGEGSTFTIRLPFAPLLSEPGAVEPAADVTGLSCMVVGSPDGLANDLSVYLEQAHATVERAPDLVSAKNRRTGIRGLSVWIVDAGQELPSRERVQETVRSNNDQDIRMVIVLIERGKRRRPRLTAPGLITVDGNALSRRTFLRAVAAAAGRVSPDEPAEKAAAGRLAAIKPSRDEAMRQGRLILIAEDNETNQKVILRQLALLGYTADVAANGLEALNQWRSGDYALLLTDLHMPQMDGYELTEAIRAEESDGKRIPIIALTANALKGEADRCRAVGMDDYRSKPSPLAELKAVLNKWLPLNGNGAPATAPPSAAPAATPHAATTLPVDVSVLQQLVGDDPAMIREFLQDFRSSSGKIAAELRTACAARQPAAAAAAAHKLKSSARAVGAFALGELCAGMEEEGKAGDLDALMALLPRFDAEMALVESYLDSR